MTIRRSSSPCARRRRLWRSRSALQASGPEGKPLYGVPFAVKDNIDVAGLPTTAACPAFAYSPRKSAFVVERLERAGAIVIGKTNLDQFATGLVGVRSPYGIPRNALQARSHSRRLELRLGDRGRRGPRSVFARHRHGGIGPRAGGAQRHRRPEALARRSFRRPASSPPAERSTRSRSSRSMSPTRSRSLRRPALSTRAMPTLACFLRRRFRRCRAEFGSAFHAPISGSSSTTPTRQPLSRGTLSLPDRSARGSSNSTSSRSPRSLAPSTRVRGSPSAMPRSSR